MREALIALNSCDLLIFIGTSFSVGITSIATEIAAERQVPMWVLNNEPNPHTTFDFEYYQWFEGKAEEILPQIVR